MKVRDLMRTLGIRPLAGDARIDWELTFYTSHGYTGAVIAEEIETGRLAIREAPKVEVTTLAIEPDNPSDTTLEHVAAESPNVGEGSSSDLRTRAAAAGTNRIIFDSRDGSRFYPTYPPEH